MIIAIDPGVRVLGWALFFGDSPQQLGACGISRVPASIDLAGALTTHAIHVRDACAPIKPDIVVVESMVSTHGRRTTPQDLIDVQTIGVGVACLLRGAVRLLKPSEWKGTIPKEIHHERIRAALSDLERAQLERAISKAPKQHHKEILDAVGIGLYHLQRTNRSGGKRND